VSDRSHAIDRFQRYLVRRGLPRFQMTVIVVATGLAGFGASVALLSLGVSSMPARYLAAVVAAYAVFLLLVRLWAEYQRRHLSAADAIDIAGDLLDLTRVPEPWTGGRGTFGGGGAGRSWDDTSPDLPSSAAPSPETPLATTAVEAGSTGASHAFDVDVDDAWVLVVLPIILLGGLLAAVYVIYSAPVLLGEVLLDVALVSGLYRRLRKLEPQSWLSTAVRRTWIPVTVVALLVAAGGFVMQAMVPDADSIGDVLRAPRR
jgi:hypothetical protein